MNLKKIEEAEKAANEFLTSLKILKQLKLADEEYKNNTEEKYWVSSNHPKESGQTRRDSLDLTRKLAELRKP